MRPHSTNASQSHFPDDDIVHGGQNTDGGSHVSAGLVEAPGTSLPDDLRETESEGITSQQVGEEEHHSSIREESEAAGIESHSSYPDPNWLSRLSLTKEGHPHNALGNVIRTLQFSPYWHGVFKYDSFSDTVLFARAIPCLPDGIVGKSVTDRHVALITSALMDTGFRCSSKLVFEAICTVAKDYSFHPVLDYLEVLSHDGRPRLENWLNAYCGADKTSYTMAVGRFWMISAVARIFEPGCKADCCLILEGRQGTKKSTALKILGGDWFSDTVHDLGSKDAKVAMRGTWIIELSELAALNRKEAADIKAFMSASTDRYRPPYGRAAMNFPRQCVYAGTVNDSTYFNDETGQRRFWPVEVRNIDADALERDRDQLWAEAVVHYKRGVPWFLNTPELVAEAEKQQRAKLSLDVWHEQIMAYCERHPLASTIGVSINAILSEVIKKPLAQQTQSDMNRVARTLKVAGYLRSRGPGPNRPWLYKKADVLPRR